jgi:hypothetical protein
MSSTCFSMCFLGDADSQAPRGLVFKNPLLKKSVSQGFIRPVYPCLCHEKKKSWRISNSMDAPSMFTQTLYNSHMPSFRCVFTL